MSTHGRVAHGRSSAPWSETGLCSVICGATPKSRREEATDWLVRRGFDFDYHTHLSTTQDGRLVVMCYDEGYLLNEGRVVPWEDDGSTALATLAP